MHRVSSAYDLYAMHDDVYQDTQDAPKNKPFSRRRRRPTNREGFTCSDAEDEKSYIDDDPRHLTTAEIEAGLARGKFTSPHVDWCLLSSCFQLESMETPVMPALKHF